MSLLILVSLGLLCARVLPIERTASTNLNRILLQDLVSLGLRCVRSPAPGQPARSNLDRFMLQLVPHVCPDGVLSAGRCFFPSFRTSG